MLMRALLEGQLQPDTAMNVHFERCLHCGSCTNMCPAKVPYARLIDSTKHYLRQRGDRPALPLWLRMLAASRTFRRVTTVSLTLAHACGISHRSAVSGLCRKVAPNIDTLPAFKFRHCRDLHPGHAGGNASGDTSDDSPGAKVALFTGCVADVFDRETLWASRNLLEALSKMDGAVENAAEESAGEGAAEGTTERGRYTVAVPRNQMCCGSLHHHNGDIARSKQYIAGNCEAFSDARTIVTCASGCGLFLREHMPQQVVDIGAFIEQKIEQKIRGTAAPPTFRPFPARVALHTPCTLRNAFSPSMTIRLLRRIPDIQLEVLPSGGECCGAAGIQVLNQPHIALALGRRVIEQVGDCDILLTGNVGCALHLRRMARRAARANRANRGRRGKGGALKPIEVMHPVTLLWRQLAHPTKQHKITQRQRSGG